jgi:hypothetical protein
MATTAGDLERIVKSEKIAAVLTLEGAHQIADDPAVLRIISGSASVPCRSRIFETTTGPIHGEAAAQRGSRISANK